MGQVQTSTYAGTSSAANYHQITFSGARAGNRLMVVVSAQVDISSYASGWTYVTGAGTSGRRVAIFTKIAGGGENYFWVDLVSSTRVCHMFMAERDDTLMQVRYVAGVDDGDSMSLNLPKGGYIIGGVHYGGGSVQYVSSWPRSMYTAHRASHANSDNSYYLSSSFAHRWFDASGFTFYVNDVSIPVSGWAYAFAVFGPDSVPPSTPTGLSVSEATSSSAKLSWNASSDNVAVTGYKVYVNGSQVATTTSGVRAYSFTGLPSGTPISLGVAAHDALGNTSSIATTTVTLDGTPPSQPGRLRLTAMTTTSLTVAWQPSTDNVGVAGYGVYRGGIRVAEQAGLTYTFNGLTTGVPVTIEVDAYDSAGNRSSRAAVTATPKVDTTPPDPPKIRIVSLGAGKIGISWDEPADDSAVASYGVYLNGTKQGPDQVEQTKSWSGLTPGGLYTVAVDAVDLAGNRSQKGTRTVRAQPDTTPPTVPANLRVVAASQTSVTVTWDPSTDDNAGVNGYGVYLGVLPQAEIPSLVYTFSGLTPGITYSLAVDAVDDVGNRSARAVVSVTTLEDLSGAAPPYEYVFYDWDTHTPLDSLPLQGVTLERALGGGGSLGADIPLFDAAYSVGRVAAATRPERTMVLVYRGERFVGGGRLIDPQDYSSETGILRVTGEEATGIYGRRFVAYTGPRLASLAHTEVVWLLEHAASPSDLRWLTHAGASGSVATDREYREEELTPILGKVEEVASGVGGFDWWVAPAWDGVNDRPKFELRRVDRDNPPTTGLTLEYPGNVRSYTRTTQRGLETRTRGRLPLPDGGQVLSTVTRTDLLSEGWPLLEGAWQFDGLTSQAALDAATQRASEGAAGPKHVFEFTLAVGPDVRWWEWELGGLAQVVITDHLYPAQPDGAPGLDRQMKIVSVRVQPDSAEGELVTVTTGEFTVAVD